MSRVVEFALRTIMPSDEEVLAFQGVPSGTVLPDGINISLVEAKEIFIDKSVPVGLISKAEREDAMEILDGEGNNEPENPVKSVFEKAERFSAFALTIGAGVSDEIGSLFETSDFAVASMLDSIASLAADNAAEECERLFSNEIIDSELSSSDFVALGYSPGYCGWHVSGQRKLFEYLHPGEIGISLNSSFLMTPLKSVSGIIAGGRKEIHRFKPVYSFCRDCKTFSCLERMRSLNNSYS